MTASPPPVPSAWTVGECLRIIREMRERVSTEPGAIETDDDDIRLAFDLDEMPNGTVDPRDVLRRLVLAAIEAEAMVDSISLRIQHLRDRARRYQHRNDQYRQTTALIMDALGTKRETFDEATVSLRESKGGAVVITDAETLADEYVRVIREPDKLKIRQALLDGEVVDGATLAQGGNPVLTIRTK